MIPMRIYQFSCRETNKIDRRQADAVLRHAPDIIFWESPSKTERKASLVFDPRKPIAYQEKALTEMIQHRRAIAKKYKWVLSDIATYQNTITLVRRGHKVGMYNVDAPRELLQQTILHGWNRIEKPRRRGVHLLWWVYIYLRERMMADNIAPLLKGNKTALMFLQKFHWLNVKFLLSRPTKDNIWHYYFGRFTAIDRSTLSTIIKEKNSVLYHYWVRHSDFV